MGACLGTPVSINVYDLSGGKAKEFAGLLTGEGTEGIWHTGVVLRGREYFFSGGGPGDGLLVAPAGQTPYGKPVRSHSCGRTQRSRQEVAAWLTSPAVAAKYDGPTYHLFRNNCNHFAAEFVHWLTGGTIPDYIANQAVDIFGGPLGMLLFPIVAGLYEVMQAGIQADQARPEGGTRRVERDEPPAYPGGGIHVSGAQGAAASRDTEAARRNRGQGNPAPARQRRSTSYGGSTEEDEYT